jgi:hypothetical protein
VIGFDKIMAIMFMLAMLRTEVKWISLQHIYT